MKKIVIMILAASLLFSSCGSVTNNTLNNNSDNISDNISDNKSAKEKEKMLTFSVNEAVMRIEVCDADIIRVQYFPG